MRFLSDSDAEPFSQTAADMLFLLGSQFIKGDIQSGDLLRYVMDTEEIDTVMHFAAQVAQSNHDV